VKKIIVGGLLAAAAVAIYLVGVSILDTMEEMDEESGVEVAADIEEDALTPEERKDA
jgi:hypothetical protein